jgi:copper transport protein
VSLGVLPPAQENARSSGLAGTAARWLASAPALAAFGLLLLPLLALPQFDARRLRRGSLLVVPLAIAGALLFLFAQLSTVGGIEALRATLASRWGVLWSLRAPALAAALALLLAKRDRVALVAIAVSLAAASGSSHAAASSSALAATIADFAHRTAAGAWLGGLVGLLLSWRTAQDRVALVRAFTALATVAVAGLLAFGLVGALAEVGSWGALTTDYGLVLLLKIGGTVLVLGLAAVNRWWLAPRLAGEGVRWLPRLAAVEAVMLVLLAAFGARLASIEPAWQDAGEEGLTPAARTVEDLRIELRILPGIVGTNDIEVWLRDRHGKPVEGARVAVTLTGPGLEPEEISAHDLREGLYHVPGPALNVAGSWSFAIDAQRDTAFDARTTYDLEIGATPPDAPPPSGERVAVATVLATLVFVGVVVASLPRRRRQLAPSG